VAFSIGRSPPKPFISPEHCGNTPADLLFASERSSPPTAFPPAPPPPLAQTDDNQFSFLEPPTSPARVPPNPLVSVLKAINFTYFLHFFFFQVKYSKLCFPFSKLRFPFFFFRLFTATLRLLFSCNALRGHTLNFFEETPSFSFLSRPPLRMVLISLHSELLFFLVEIR